MVTRKVIQVLAGAIQARQNCIDTNNTLWRDNHEETIRLITLNCLPHGSGIDADNTVDLGKSTGERVVIHTSFHHMDENGYYDGWTEHTLTITPSFSGINIKISGRNRNDIKDYLVELFAYALEDTLTYDIDTNKQLVPDRMLASSKAYKEGIANGTII